MPNPFELDPSFNLWWNEATAEAQARSERGFLEYGDSYAMLGLEGMAYRILEKALRLRQLCESKSANTDQVLDTVLDLHVLGHLAHAFVIGDKANT